MVDDRWNPELEIMCRIEQARATFLKLKKFPTNRNLNFKLRYRMVKCYVWLVLLYGAEAWTLKAAAINRIEQFEMWTLRRMLKISWTEHVRKDDGWIRRPRTLRTLKTKDLILGAHYMGRAI
nr:unnamed protein product [Callosobruchus chinensis]